MAGLIVSFLLPFCIIFLLWLTFNLTLQVGNRFSPYRIRLISLRFPGASGLSPIFLFRGVDQAQCSEQTHRGEGAASWLIWKARSSVAPSAKRYDASSRAVTHSDTYDDCCGRIQCIQRRLQD